ncbi:hypothetical protein G6N76_23785 [Rhizobium daejeonense]|uniref:Abi family protein n=1 Tax=Rhizobium daejeonense TaxID=240521 RepID=A0A6M1S667_9HYPH|nr:hypothetical protein [Rhizobium daejeonense]NGO66689.1 hypothetical protein [Rhizobium daejeonense]
MPFTHDEIHNLPTVLSAPRFATYLAEKAGDKEAALELYQWNLELSSAFFVPLQICEVSVRNSIVSAIESTYGPNWPWERGFEISLRNPPTGYSPRRNLMGLRSLPTSGKIVAELSFVFWEKMLTHGHDGAIWNAHFRTVFPNTDSSRTVQALRGEGNDTLFKIRDLRNRIAHHEPIFRRNIQEEYERIRKIISWSNLTAAAWLDKIENVTSMIARKP